MKELKGNLFDMAMEPGVDSICITTNGIVGATGLATMGAGVAGEAARRWPSVRANLGKALKRYGNKPYVIGYLDKKGEFNDPFQIAKSDYKCLIWSFPTKNDFRFKSDMSLIEMSCKTISKFATDLNLKHICLSRPGCSNGKLLWSDVKAVIEPLLDDRFSIISFEHEE